MDGNRFDGLTRAMARGTSRRTVLRGIAGGAAGGGLAAIGLQRVAGAQVDATCPGLSDAECGEGSICCAGVCREIECCIDEADPNARCPEGTTCSEGICFDFCTDDNECEDGACCCPDGSCLQDCCADDPDTDDDPDADDDDPLISTLPNTGIGQGQDSGRWVGASLVAGAAVWLASRQIRQSPGDSPEATG
ncbi:hypothetical protein BH23CHL5_BH23CHL5_23750 [soil metagenome]